MSLKKVLGQMENEELLDSRLSQEIAQAIRDPNYDYSLDEEPELSEINKFHAMQALAKLKETMSNFFKEDE